MYQQLYHLLFNAITDALRQLDAQNPGQARETLMQAQQGAEEALLAAGERCGDAKRGA